MPQLKKEQSKNFLQIIYCTLVTPYTNKDLTTPTFYLSSLFFILHVEFFTEPSLTKLMLNERCLLKPQ